jgi:dipeptidyl aminopeptidase/acylaminoacyl peptidase
LPLRPLPLATVVILLVLVGVVALGRSIGLGGRAPGTTVAPAGVRVWFSPTVGTEGLELAAPLRVLADIPDPDPNRTGPRPLPDVQLELRDGTGQPAIFGPGPALPEPMFLQGANPAWTADLSAPTVPGVYHAQLTIHISGQPTQTFDLPDPPLKVVAPSAPLQSGYVYDRDGNLWLTASDGQRTRKLTFYPRTERAWQPAWAPDGSRVAYSRSLPVPATDLPIYEIWSVQPDGSNNQPLVARRPGEDLLYPAWTPDGQRLLFTSDQVLDPATGGTPTDEHLSEGVETWTIETVDATGGARRPLIADAQMPDMSRDGRYLVYVAAPTARSEVEQIMTHTLMIADADGGNARVLVPPDQFQDVQEPRFSPDGQQVAFSAVNPGGWEGGLLPWFTALLAPPVSANGVPWDIYLVAAAGGAPRRLTHLQADLPTVAWGADSQHLALLTDKGIYQVPLDGSTPVRLAPGSIHGFLTWYTR